MVVTDLLASLIGAKGSNRTPVSGSAVFYLLVSIPMMLTLGSVAIDVANVFATRDKLQTLADEISFEAASLLPDEERARSYVNQRLAGHPEVSVVEEGTEITSSQISLVLHQDVAIPLAIFTQQVNQDLQTISIQRHARVSLLPTDIVILFSDSVALRPDAFTAWGRVSEWPASFYFDRYRAPVNDVPTGEAPTYWPSWEQEWQNPVFRRYATQSCFNPEYSPLKLSVISLIDISGRSELNRLSVITSPGDGNPEGFLELRPLLFPSQTAATAEATWSSYFEVESFFSDELCAYFATSTISGDVAYQLPGTLYGMKRDSTPYSVISETPILNTYHYPRGNLSADFFETSLSLRESVYFHAARSYANASDASNIISSLSGAYSKLSSADPGELDLLRSKRENLTSVAQRKIVAIVDTLPSGNDSRLNDLLALITDAGIELSLVAYAHEGLETDTSNALIASATALSNSQAWGNKVQVYVASSGEELVENILPLLLRSSNHLVLRS